MLTGETGAGKSILLDSLGLALGARSDTGLVRAGAAQASVAARFAPPPDHPVHALLDELGLPRDEELVLRRVVERAGRSRAWVNDAPVGAAALKQVGQMLVEVQGQHDQMGLADPAGHLSCSTISASARDLRAASAALTAPGGRPTERLAAARARLRRPGGKKISSATPWASWRRWRPRKARKCGSPKQRQRLQQGEKRAEAIEAALAELTPSDRRSHAARRAAACRGRVLQRLSAPPVTDRDPAAGALAALERAEEALAEAEQAC